MTGASAAGVAAAVATTATWCALCWAWIPRLARLLAARARERASVRASADGTRGTTSSASSGADPVAAAPPPAASVSSACRREQPRGGRWASFIGAAGGTAWLLAIRWMGAAGLLGPAAAGCLLAAGCFVLVAALCDVWEGLIPNECCAGVGAAGLAAQTLSFGLEGLLEALFAALCIVAVVALAGLVARGGGSPIGGGDAKCMVALALASGSGALAGAFASFALAAAGGIVAACAKGRALDEPIRLGPAFLAWLPAAALAIAGG